MRTKLTLALGALALASACNEPSVADIIPDGPSTPGNLGDQVKVDSIVQVTKPKVDVLWVIDDSCSMAEEQIKLQENFDAFIGFFLNSGLDWHIGVISTDTEDPTKSGKLQRGGGRRYIDPQTAFPEQIFTEMSTLGTTGTATERGLLASYRALGNNTQDIQRANEGFYRDDAALHVIVISDENDQSAPLVNRNEYITFLQNLKDDRDTPVTFNSIVGPRPAGCNNTDTNASPGTTYISVTEQVGGIFRSICEEEWEPVLEELGLQAAGLRREYFLTELPVLDTLDVWVVDGGQSRDGVLESEVPQDLTAQQYCAQNPDLQRTACFPYYYDPARNSIVLTDYVPRPSAVVNIQYSLLTSRDSQGEDVVVIPGTGETGDTGE